MKLIVRLFVLPIFTALATGCASIADGMDQITENLQAANDARMQKRIASSEDSALAAAMTTVEKPAWGRRLEPTVYKNVVDLTLVQHTEADYTKDIVQIYRQTSSEIDPIEQAYIDFARGRGSQVKIYKTPVNRDICNSLSMDKLDGYRYSSSSDPALIEYAADGRMISALCRTIGVSPQTLASKFVYQTTRIFMGSAIGAYEARVSNQRLAEFEFGTPQ